MYPKPRWQRRQDNAAFAQATTMPLQFLEFDRCEDSDGLYSWDALASPAAHHNRELLAEVRGVLARLQSALGPAGPLDEGHAWDMDLQIQDGQGQPLALEAADTLVQRLRLSLCLSGSEALAELLTDMTLN